MQSHAFNGSSDDSGGGSVRVDTIQLYRHIRLLMSMGSISAEEVHARKSAQPMALTFSSRVSAIKELILAPLDSAA